MKIKYDNEVNAAYLYLIDIEPGGVDYTLCTEDNNINLDFDADHRLVGIEILNASNLLPVGLIGSNSIEQD